jgi:hypothetical protein
MIRAKNDERSRRFRVGGRSGPKLSTQQLLGGVATLPTAAVIQRHLVYAVDIDDYKVVHDCGRGHRTCSIDVVPVA